MCALNPKPVTSAGRTDKKMRKYYRAGPCTSLLEWSLIRAGYQIESGWYDTAVQNGAPVLY
jgi:hypothetical protein